MLIPRPARCQPPCPAPNVGGVARERRRDPRLRARSGSAAVEFAFVLPFALVLYVGMSEVGHSIDGWRKLTLLARTVADLTSEGDQQTPMAAATLSDIMGSATTVMRPFATTQLKVVISAMGVQSTAAGSHPYVCSSAANANATARNTGAAADLTVPAGYLQVGNRYILAEVSMPYAPMTGATFGRLVPGLANGITLSMKMPWPVRGGQAYGSNTYAEVILPGGSQCP